MEVNNNMALEDMKEYAEENAETSASTGKTTIRLETGLVADFKKELGVSQNKEVAPAVAVLIAEALEDEDAVEEYEEEFREVVGGE